MRSLNGIIFPGECFTMVGKIYDPDAGQKPGPGGREKESTVPGKLRAKN